jgi:hypothetical protein
MKKNIKNIISVAFSHSISISLFKSENREQLPDNLKKFFLKKINPNTINDRELISNVEMHNFINWEIMDRKKVIRILARDIDFLDKIDMFKYNFSTTELYPIFLQYPELIKQFVNNFEELNPLELIKLLECNYDLIDEIDITKYHFNKKDTIEIVKKFRNSKKIMERIDLSILDHFSTRKLICRTGIDYIDRLDMKSLKNTDWIEILKQHPDLIEFCNLKIFENNDCYLLTKLVLMFPDLEYLIHDNIEKISSLGWENLVLEDLEKYQDICKWEKLNETNWNKITKKHPSLNYLKQKYFLF